jgi:hypothetical protein
MMARQLVDPVVGELTPCTMLMHCADWQALRAADWAGLAPRLGRRARRPHRSQREVVLRLRSLADGGAQPRQAR